MSDWYNYPHPPQPPYDCDPYDPYDVLLFAPSHISQYINTRVCEEGRSVHDERFV